jgi:hypothetical protein
VAPAPAAPVAPVAPAGPVAPVAQAAPAAPVDDASATPPHAQPPPAMPDAPVERDFVSIQFLAGGDDDEVRQPLPLATEQAPPAEPQAPDVPVVRGLACAVGHVNRLEAKYCNACGRRLQGTIHLVEGPRPLLGIIVFDDGSTYGLDADYVIGREPSVDRRVAEGRVRPLVLEDPDRALSRAHAEIHLEGWDTTVIDLGSANGTFVLPPGAAQWLTLQPGNPIRLEDGARVAVGRRVFVFEQH